MKYIKQLDAIRAYAVLLVIVGHWLRPNSWINALPNAFIGVTIFFVLSGFLITRILLNEQDRGTGPFVFRWRSIGNFYIRRILRIFPAYYFLMLILFLYGLNRLPELEQAFPYLMTYTGNIYMSRLPRFPDTFGHLWSLAVEEQFYLIWPWLMIFIRGKQTLVVIWAFIIGGIVFQLAPGAAPMHHVLTPACFDSFGLGGLLAWQLRYKPEKISQFLATLNVFGVLALVTFCILFVQHTHFFISDRTLISIVSLNVLALIVCNQEHAWVKKNPFLNHVILIWIGKVSYGLYLYHNFVPRVLNDGLLGRFINPFIPFRGRFWGVIYVSENLVLLLLITLFSYWCIERPFLRMKNHFISKKLQVKAEPII
jgi:peptidoglycan/LPS O-acetylase OafA/YrhL